MNTGSKVGSRGSESKGSTGMCCILQKSSGKDAGMGQTFLATFLYAKVTMDGSMDVGMVVNMG